ncbi:MAG: type II toxin-antitoxin system prevent-host-death family antitoxin [Microgenomates group bacterium]
MNIVSSTKLRSNLAEALKKVSKEKYLLISKRGKVGFAILDYKYLINILKGAGNTSYEDLEKQRLELEGVYK